MFLLVHKYRAKRKEKKKAIFGFTLIELIIVVGILATLLSIVLIAINPLEQISKAQDVSTKAVVKDYAASANYYFTSKKTLPWITNTSCRNELSSETTLDDATSCNQELTQGGQLQNNFAAAEEPKNVFITECNDAIALCYKPKSQAFGKSPEAKYSKNGVLKTDCPGSSSECYSCTFSTNEAQACFQALSPSGNLALVPSPSPEAPLPIPERNSKDACDDPGNGRVGCLAQVVTDSAGTPLASIALPAGFGPEQIHKAYNLPCTPGGGVSSKCLAPTVFGPQILAVVVAYNAPTIESDLAGYSSTYGLPQCTVANGCLIIVNQNGGSSPLPSTNSNWALEASMDVEISHALCQTCKILLVEAQSNAWTDISVAANRAALMGATSISNSYGSVEWSNEASYDSYFNHPNIFITASSGDSGYGNSYPASSKDVISVGGTTLALLSNNTYSSESVWNGTGSGCSPYQNAYNFQTSLPNWNLTGCGSRRSNTDVSADANPSTGVAVLDSTDYSGHSGWWILGGTSLSSPIVAAALAMQGGLEQASTGPSYIYLNKNKFRDVTTGSNGGCGSSTACNAAVGYDGPTGLGSPNMIPDALPTSVPTPTTIPTATPTIMPPTETPISSPSATPTLAPTPTSTTAPTPSPTAAPVNCSTQQTVTLTPSTVPALPGDTLSFTLSIVSNDTPSCSPLYTISYGYPAGWGIVGIPTSFNLSGGATKNIPVTVSIPANGITAGNYVFQFWVAKQGQSIVNPVNGTIQITQGSPTVIPTPTLSPTPTPTPTPFPTGIPTLSPIDYNGLVPGYAIDQSKFFKTFAVYFFTYPGFPTSSGSGWNMQISTRADFTGDYTQQSNSFGIPDSYGQDAPLNASYAALRQITSKYVGFASITNYTFYNNNCGHTIYWRITNFYNPSATNKLYGPTYTGIIDCTTKVNVVDPPLSWYTVFDQGGTNRQKQYQASWDFDKNGVIDWTDYWLGAFSTKFRSGGWQPPE